MITEVHKDADGQYILVVPSSKKDKSYAVRCIYIPRLDEWDALCTCDGYAYRMSCRHMKEAIAYAKANLPKTASNPVSLKVDVVSNWIMCPVCTNKEFYIMPAEKGKPYKNFSMYVVCSKCGAKYELTGTEGKI